jgi:two-component system, NarL family, invasion response regulator UvrY
MSRRQIQVLAARTHLHWRVCTATRLHRDAPEADARTRRNQPMRVLIVDDHPIIAAACEVVFADYPEIELLEAVDADSGEQVFLTGDPDICIFDLNLPGPSGLELLRRVRRRDENARVIMFSVSDDPVVVEHMIEAGARGFVSKARDPNVLVEAVHEVARGGIFVPAPRGRRALESREKLQDPAAKLNLHEIQLLRLLGAGHSAAEIAEIVNVPYKTVINRSTSMRRKLGVKTSIELMRFAIENKIV